MRKKALAPRTPFFQALQVVYRSWQAEPLGCGAPLQIASQRSLSLVLLGSDYQGHPPRCLPLCSQVAIPFFVRSRRITLGRQMAVSSCQERSGRRAVAARQTIAPLQPPNPNRLETGNTRSRRLPGCRDPPDWLTPHRQSTDRQMSGPR